MSTLLETGATFQDLQEFLRLEGCAVCRYAVQSCHRYFDTLLYEGANDPAVHARFEQGGAFCPLHGETLLAWRDALATALIYGNLVSQRRRLLAHWRSGGLHGRGPRAADVDRTLPGRDCPACAAEREATTRACAVLAGGLRSGPLAAAWQASPGLCWPHFLTVRAQCAGPTRPLLDEVQDRGMGQLERDVRALAESFDYQSTIARTPEIESAWRRSVDAVVGRSLSAHPEHSGTPRAARAAEGAKPDGVGPPA